MNPRILAPDWNDYELIDAGNSQKLERWGNVITIRPENSAYFKPVLPFSDWLKKAHFRFHPKQGVFGEWESLSGKDLTWEIQFGSVRYRIQLKNTKHTGVFPEQSNNWNFIEQVTEPGHTFLNLFGYSGASSLIALSKGAQVIHVDSSKSALNWCQENLQTNGFEGCKLVHEDALQFISREVKRGHKYDLIQMDPPAWGIGKNGKKWKLDLKIDELITTAALILNPSGRMLVSTYSPGIDGKLLSQIGKFSFPTKSIEIGMLSTQSRTNKILEHGWMMKVF